MTTSHTLHGATSYLAAIAMLVGKAAVAQSPSAQPTSCTLGDLPFTLNGDAEFTEGCALQLTSEEGHQSGSAFTSHDFEDTTSYPFEVFFEYDITDTGVGGSADGIAFVMHIDPAELNALNDAGGAMGVYGAGGIHCALVVELDTYFGPTNAGPDAPFSLVDYTRAIDIITTDTEGNAIRYAEVDVTSIFTMNGKVWISHKDGTLDVYLAPQSSLTRPSVPTVSVDIDVPTVLLNRDTVFLGFSSSTGGEYDKHEIVSFAFEETAPSPSVYPSVRPTISTLPPTVVPSVTPTKTPTESPTFVPTTTPTATPTGSPTVAPSASPSTMPSESPTVSPSLKPTTPSPVSTVTNRLDDVTRCDEDDSKGKGKGKGKGGSKGGSEDDDDDSKGQGKGKGKGGSKGGSGCGSSKAGKGKGGSKGQSDRSKDYHSKAGNGKGGSRRHS